MMEEDYVDPAGRKPDIVAKTKDSITRIYERDSDIRGHGGDEEGRESGRDELPGFSRRLVSRSEPSQQDAPASSFSLTSAPISFRLPSPASAWRRNASCHGHAGL